MNARMAGRLGLALRSGALAVGTEAAADAIRRQRAELVIVAGDAGRSTRARLAELAAKARVAVRAGPGRGEMGRALGRGAVAVVVVSDPRWARQFMEDDGGGATE